MSKQIMCSLFCPMINKFGVCESTLRRVKVNLPAGQREGTLGCEQVRACPHLEMRERVSPRGLSLAPAGQFTLSKLNTNKK